ncbi:hypothetical protein YSA_01487 [Pseudomonas putida ND6]|uniref:Uncharacterized protein n=1 Tax=Pseudomonas putida ND6 TaxID=231023 RepID=I3UQ13_PSEPU|nr:hypothetical protein YSA_01487 [Pseudomonas putida ND6]
MPYLDLLHISLADQRLYGFACGQQRVSAGVCCPPVGFSLSSMKDYP